MRELTDYEVEQVSGGGAIATTLGLGAGLGGLFSAGHYALGNLNSPNFSWGVMAGRTIQGATSGLLLGAAGLAAITPGGSIAAASLGGASFLVGSIGNINISRSPTTTMRGGGSW